MNAYVLSQIEERILGLLRQHDRAMSRSEIKTYMVNGSNFATALLQEALDDLKRRRQITTETQRYRHTDQPYIAYRMSPNGKPRR